MDGVHRTAPFAAAIVVALSCSPGPKLPVQSPPTSVARHPTGPTYRFVRMPAHGRLLDDAGSLGFVLGADRAAVTADGSVTFAPMAPQTPFLAAAPIPPRLGGGFVFLTSTVVYRARSYLAPLEPVARVPSPGAQIGFGPDSLVVIHGTARQAYDLETRQPRALSPQDPVDTATDVDGGVTAIDAMRVEADRTLEMAVSGGIAMSDGDVLVAAGAEVFVVDLESCSRLGVARDVAPPEFRCEALSAADEGLAACYGPKGAVSVVSHVLGAQPRVEKQFALPPTTILRDEDDGGPQGQDADDPLTVAVSYGAGMLLVGARCGGIKEPGVVCVRKRTGAWVEHDGRLALRAAGAKSWHVELWVPGEDGDVAAVLGLRTGTGDLIYDGWAGHDATTHRQALLDVPTGKVTELDQEIEDRGLLAYQGASGHRYASRRTRTGWLMMGDGTLRGFTAKGSVAADHLGRVVGRLRAFQDLSVAGARALARDHDGRWLQSTDYGATWVQIAGPPSGQAFSWVGGNPECSDAGCFAGTVYAGRTPGAPFSWRVPFGAWLRVGWPVEPPQVALKKVEPDPGLIPEPAEMPPELPP
jgi:hypothetical protein